MTPPHPSSRARAGWALPSGLTGPPRGDTGIGSSITAAVSHVTARGNPAPPPGPQPTGSPFAAHRVSFRSPLGFLSSSESEKVTPRGEESRSSRELAGCLGLQSLEMNKQRHSARPRAFPKDVGPGARLHGNRGHTGPHRRVRASHAGRDLLSLLSLSAAPLPRSKACPPCLRLLRVRGRG